MHDLELELDHGMNLKKRKEWRVVRLSMVVGVRV